MDTEPLDPGEEWQLSTTESYPHLPANQAQPPTMELSPGSLGLPPQTVSQPPSTVHITPASASYHPAIDYTSPYPRPQPPTKPPTKVTEGIKPPQTNGAPPKVDRPNKACQKCRLRRMRCRKQPGRECENCDKKGLKCEFLFSDGKVMTESERSMAMYGEGFTGEVGVGVNKGKGGLIGDIPERSSSAWSMRMSYHGPGLAEGSESVGYGQNQEDGETGRGFMHYGYHVSGFNNQGTNTTSTPAYNHSPYDQAPQPQYTYQLQNPHEDILEKRQSLIWEREMLVTQRAELDERIQELDADIHTADMQMATSGFGGNFTGFL